MYKKLQTIIFFIVIIILIIITNLVGNIMVHSWISATPSIPLVLHLQIVVKILLMSTSSVIATLIVYIIFIDIIQS